MLRSEDPEQKKQDQNHCDGDEARLQRPEQPAPDVFDGKDGVDRQSQHNAELDVPDVVADEGTNKESSCQSAAVPQLLASVEHAAQYVHDDDSPQNVTKEGYQVNFSGEHIMFLLLNSCHKGGRTHENG